MIKLFIGSNRSIEWHPTIVKHCIPGILIKHHHIFHHFIHFYLFLYLAGPWYFMWHLCNKCIFITFSLILGWKQSFFKFAHSRLTIFDKTYKKNYLNLAHFTVFLSLRQNMKWLHFFLVLRQLSNNVSCRALHWTNRVEIACICKSIDWVRRLEHSEVQRTSLIRVINRGANRTFSTLSHF